MFSLARYDMNYDLRDKGRFLTSLLRGVAGGVYSQTEDTELDEEKEARDGVILRAAQVEHVLFEGKVAPKDDDRWSSERLLRYPESVNSSLALADAPSQLDTTSWAPLPLSLITSCQETICASSLNGQTKAQTRPCVTRRYELC